MFFFPNAIDVKKKTFYCDRNSKKTIENIRKDVTMTFERALPLSLDRLEVNSNVKEPITFSYSVYNRFRPLTRVIRLNIKGDKCQ